MSSTAAVLAAIVKRIAHWRAMAGTARRCRTLGALRRRYVLCRQALLQ
jgi:hypothetical protein